MATKKTDILPDAKRSSLALSQLLLDKSNPRFGDLGKKKIEQADILDHIVEKFGVDDVISSLAVNGYFEAEPLVCQKTKDGKKFTVVEGNRRLAACLILIGDVRASRQAKKTEQFQKVWEQHGKKQIDPAPVIIFEHDEKDNQDILSYLGVRHIASAQPWDSYAKASWVARVVKQSSLPIADIALMIGDQHNTITRMLEGYYFIQQLIETGNFRPEDSQRKGRGSVTEYPFSWVYTMLGYSSTRKFLDISEEEPKPNPIKSKNLRKASLVTKSMFGDRSKGQSAAISDSRDLGDLASAFANPEMVSMLENGKTIGEIIHLSKPIDERLREGLAQVREIQSALLAGITEEQILVEVAQPLLELATKNKRTAQEIEKKLNSTVNPEAEDE
jgi:hypothetical protein